MIPDWAPNIHPMVVHLPIALLVVAVLVDLLSLFWRRLLATTALTLYILGALGTVASFLSGKAAADTVSVSDQASVLLTTHADWATVALWYFVAYALLRLVVALRAAWRGNIRVQIPLILVAAGGLFVIYKTADHGGRMVYEHGVGVAAVEAMASQLESSQREIARLKGGRQLPEVREDGSWRWMPGSYAADAFLQAFVLKAGDLQASVQGDTVLALVARRAPALVVLESDFGSVQVDLDLGLTAFRGSVQVVYNVQDSLNYHYTEFASGHVRQGRMVAGESQILEDESFVPASWARYRAVSDRTHFRAYADGEMIIHSHGPAPGPGSVGLRLAGDGVLLLGFIAAERLR